MTDLTNEDKIFIIQNYLVNSNSKYYTILSNVIDTYNLEHSANMNGIFLNLTMLDDDILNDIYFRFINSENSAVEITYNEIKLPKTINTVINKFEKDKLTLDKFDKYLLQKSSTNISI